jgi:hypothetical protein
MKSARAPGATSIGGTMLAIVARVDTEVLQWPGGSLIALSLVVYAAIAVLFKSPVAQARCHGVPGVAPALSVSAEGADS